ncbi:MAG: radical SAM family heme chaperone HemW [Deltaproteobacteria bacterium]|nr:radical SAM family heme chaperone HemW [Deltaproteobacteria bacterium]
MKTVRISIDEGPIGVYVHVPVCASKCPYCDFNSVAARPPEERYVKTVLSELAMTLEREALVRPLSSIYVGGGTPSLLSPEAIAAITGGIRSAFGFRGRIEATIEVNPDTVSASKLKGYKDAGMNRLSIGVQSLRDALLSTLGRPHSATRAVEAFHEGREAGFTNAGVDLIFGVPGQGVKDWEEDVRSIIALGPEHVSVYGLAIEESTPYARLERDGVIRKPPEEDELAMYVSAIALLKDAGFHHYEISNFSRPGHEARHNRAYWRGKDYVGLGAGAHSHLSYPQWGRRWWNAASPDDYMQRIESGRDAIAGSEPLGVAEALDEAIMLGLRDLEAGMDALSFERRFNKPPTEVFSAWAALAQDGFLEEASGTLRLGAKGIPVANEVSSRLAGSAILTY